jgi:hypothetical protein
LNWNGTSAGMDAAFVARAALTLFGSILQTAKIANPPCHRAIKEGTVRAVCRQLEVPQP